MSLALLRQTLSFTLTLTQTELDALYPPASQIAPPRRRYPPQGMPLAAWHEGHFNNTFVTPTPPSQARLLAPRSLLPTYRLLTADYSVEAYFPQAGVLVASTLLPPPLPLPLPLPLLLASHYLLQASIFRRAYYSAVSFTDRNVGVLLDELSALRLADRTLVALVGDHGWQLGEMDLCRKMLRAWRAPSW